MPGDSRNTNSNCRKDELRGKLLFDRRLDRATTGSFVAPADPSKSRSNQPSTPRANNGVDAFKIRNKSRYQQESASRGSRKSGSCESTRQRSNQRKERDQQLYLQSLKCSRIKGSDLATNTSSMIVNTTQSTNYMTGVDRNSQNQRQYTDRLPRKSIPDLVDETGSSFRTELEDKSRSIISNEELRKSFREKLEAFKAMERQSSLTPTFPSRRDGNNPPPTTRRVQTGRPTRPIEQDRSSAHRLSPAGMRSVTPVVKIR